MEKYGRAKQAKDEDVVLAHCMLGNYSYRYTLRMCNTVFDGNNGYAHVPHCYVHTYVHCLSCYVLKLG